LSVNPAGFGSVVYDAGRTNPKLAQVRVSLDRPDAREPQAVPALLWNR
jgi:hypothetical protein